MNEEEEDDAEENDAEEDDAEEDLDEGMESIGGDASDDLMQDVESDEAGIQEESDAAQQKQIIKDKRKGSNVDRALIYNRLRQNNLGTVVGKADIAPVKRTVIPVGTVKMDKTVVLTDVVTEQPTQVKQIDVEVSGTDLNETIDADEIEKEIKHVENLLSQTENLDKEEAPSEIKLEELPKKIKRPRKLKVVAGPEQELINIDLTTAKIRDQLVSERLPLPSDKVIVKASAYYMNNREISVSKLNELFRPYRKDIMSDEQSLSCESRSAGAELDLLTHQKIVRDYLNLYTPYRGLLLYHGLGSGKCHAKGTSIMLADGSTKLVEDIQVGDFLMGDDSKPRTVLSLARGRDQMYDIIPVKVEKYTVNQEHILCLRASGFPKMSFNKHKANHSFNVQWLENNEFQSRTFSYDLNNIEEKRKEAEAFFENVKGTDNVYEIAVKNYLELSDKKKGFLKGYRAAIDFPEKELPMDPYMIGYWLGDGASNGSKITSQDSTVLYYFSKQLPKYGLTLNYYCQYDYGISGDGRYNNNMFLNTLKDNNMINNKHIPMIYKCNSRTNRLSLLAGLLDSDGHYSAGGFEFTQKNEALMDDVVYLARSLGFSCYKSEKKTTWTYKGEKKEGKAYRITISGNGLEEIPTLIPRKRASPRNQIKDVLVTGIQAKYVGEDEYYGFMLDGNSRYVLGDFTVTHNTATSISIAEGMKSEKKIFVLN
jgi:hypothetical protein